MITLNKYISVHNTGNTCGTSLDGWVEGRRRSIHNKPFYTLKSACGDSVERSKISYSTDLKYFAQLF